MKLSWNRDEDGVVVVYATDDQGRIAQIAYVLSSPLIDKLGLTRRLAKAMQERLADQISGGVDKRESWFANTFGDSFESPDDALEEKSLGTVMELEERAVVATAEWQLVPVTEDGDLCPCGKREGCGECLGFECEADRVEARRVDGLPAEWRARP